MISEVAIQGDGIAATCCAKLLAHRGITCSFKPNPVEGQHRPTLLINSQTQKLIGDVFVGQIFPKCAQPVRQRAVLWNPAEREPKWFQHSGFAVREDLLLERLWSAIHPQERIGDPDWTVQSSRGNVNGVHHAFGNRIATSLGVRMKDADSDVCSIEAIADGWLFLLPAGGGCGSLLAVGAEPAALLAASRLIGPQVTDCIGKTAQFPSHPRISVPLCEDRWLACGSAALAFDPICGEGAGNAVREALLASAVLARVHEGADSTGILAEYSARLLAGFARHLELSKQFYISGRRGRWWEEQIAACEQGIAWTRAKLAAAPRPRMRLVGFDLLGLDDARPTEG